MTIGCQNLSNKYKHVQWFRGISTLNGFTLCARAYTRALKWEPSKKEEGLDLLRGTKSVGGERYGVWANSGRGMKQES